MNPEPTTFPTTRIENDSISLDFLSEAGPRIVGLRLKGSDRNLLGTAPSMRVDTPFGNYVGYGGHRLWHAPEIFPRTYIPDNSGLVVKRDQRGVRLVGPLETAAGVQKTVEIELPEQGSRVTLRHRIQNQCAWPIELAPWAITMLPMGGVVILPDQSVGDLPTGLLPDRLWALWPYADLKDPRFEPHNDLILVRSDPRPDAFKIGYANKTGWVAFYKSPNLLVKRFDPVPGAPHPDFGCCAECYVKDEFIELETLGALTTLQPGATAEHVETWEVFSGIDVPATHEGLRQALIELGITAGKD
jgi:hypothetical protein